MRPTIILIAGFGDNASMFEGLNSTSLVEDYNLEALNLPGFGAPPTDEPTTLEQLARFVAREARARGAEIILAHSVASIIASLAAKQLDRQIRRIISLEGNLTADDAYFSGTAADYDDPHKFRTAFLQRLDQMAAVEPIIRRYHDAVAMADPVSLWELGKDARRFSESCVPGEVLAEAAPTTYLFNPDNCPTSTVDWLEANTMDRLVLDNATHWKSADQPDLLAEKVAAALQ